MSRTQLKKFLGKSVKRAKHLAEEYGEKAVNKVKSVRDEGRPVGEEGESKAGHPSPRTKRGPWAQCCLPWTPTLPSVKIN